MLKQAVVSVEDQSFYTNNGLDVSGTLRALIANIRGQEVVQGGSTITQQYVKNAYVGTERTLERKVKEAVLARQINRLVDKDEILFRYLDGVYLGEGASGVGAASQTYFRKPVNELSLSEAALLAGLIPAPSRYEPRGNLDAAARRGAGARRHARAGLRHCRRARRGQAASPLAHRRRSRPRPSTLVYPRPTQPTTSTPTSSTTSVGTSSRSTARPSTQAAWRSVPPWTLASKSSPTAPSTELSREPSRRSTWRWSASSPAPASCGPWWAVVSSPPRTVR